MRYATRLWITLMIVGAQCAGGQVLSEPIVPLPDAPTNLNSAKVSLGHKLFFDARLSSTESVSCASCHNLQHGGADGRPHSIGINGLIGDVNAPSVFNSSLNFRQFWDGRAKSLSEQIDGPIQNPKEMGSTWSDVTRKVRANYGKDFEEIYHAPADRDSIVDAIVNFEKTLITPNARFDRYLKGEPGAISALEKRGYLKFKTMGCVACHQGINVGGNVFQNMGVMGDYFHDRGSPLTTSDFGRFNVTHLEQDKFVFRVPSLRNVELTAPYFHDGSAQTLEQAVSIMAKYQLGCKLAKDDLDAIVAFLKTLTGEIPVGATERSPASSP